MSSSQQWSCEACTMLNTLGRTVCEVCQTPRPRSVTQPSPSSPPSQPPSRPAVVSPPVATPASRTASVPVATKWACPMCTFENSAASTACSMCTTPRPAAAAAAPTPVPAPTPAPARAAPSTPAAAAAPSPSSRVSNRSASTPASAAAPPAPAPSAAPSLPRVPPRPLPTVVDHLTPDQRAAVIFFTDMGFRADTAEITLREHNWNREAALSWLTRHPPTYAAEVPDESTVQSAVAGPSQLPRPGSLPQPNLPPVVHSGHPRPLQRPPPPVRQQLPQSAQPLQTVQPPQPIQPQLQQYRPQPAPQPHAVPQQQQQQQPQQQPPPPPQLTKAQEEAEARRRAEERERLLSEFRRKEEENKVKEKEARLQLIEETRKRQAEDDRQRKLQVIQKEREEEAARQRDREERAQRRREEESTLHSVEDALKAIETRYDMDRFVGFCQLAQRLLQKVIDVSVAPASESAADREARVALSEKVRRIKMSNEQVQKFIVRPLGALFIFHHLGFEEQYVMSSSSPSSSSSSPDGAAAAAADAAEQGFLYLPPARVDISSLRAIVERLQRALRKNHTRIPEHFLAMTPKYPEEQLYFAAIELHAILANVVAAPDQPNFRSVDLQSDSFRSLLRPIPECSAILGEFGFAPQANGIYLVVEQADIRLFEAGLLELTYEIQLRAPSQPVYKCLHALSHSYTPRVLGVLVDKVLGVLDNVLKDPRETKFHRIRLDRFCAKLGEAIQPADVEALFLCFGFDIGTSSDDISSSSALSPGSNRGNASAHSNDSSTDQSSPSSSTRFARLLTGFDAELLRVRTTECRRVWRSLCVQLAPELI